ncbi:MAG TPA: DNA helicase UvrD [Gammaproteobacteria bacterium]|nr:DNA helicase UvrD [Gammaproteobacteria bacterium]
MRRSAAVQPCLPGAMRASAGTASSACCAGARPGSTTMTEPALATDPRRSFSVLASAGTGKTWQLVARLTRLLLHGARLDSILAITFTRKAAGEMQQRLGERLRELLEADDRRLDELLNEIGERPGPQLRQRARELYERWLRSEQTLRATTFHAFCQELLRRFPLEAGLPPGFELLEQTGLLVEESWDALFADATRRPRGAAAQALETLFEALNGLHNTRAALFSFVEHRSDWWAWTQGARDPVAVARHRLAQRLEVDEEIAGGQRLWNADGRAALAEFATLLARHQTRANERHSAQLGQALAESDAEQALEAICEVFFTGSGGRRARKDSKRLRDSLGDAGAERLLELNAWACEQLEQILEHRRRRHSLRLNNAWYLAGQHMLDHYQRIKQERRLLDFSDLEWNAWRLLTDSEHAHWIQYKLDQRIDHLLIDEFQDTNPTQWQLVLPLLEEIAAGGERDRSLFIVGDAKQSIYRFRRGNPRLLQRAADWMRQHLGAGTVRLDLSRRSAPAVIEVVNRVFRHPELAACMPDFQTHEAHRQDAWGRVELWPLVTPGETESTDTTATELRNPLQQRRRVAIDDRHYREGEAVARRIHELLEQGLAGYDDILILMRARTHLADYEAALRDQGIPYLSLDRGTLLQSLEIRDLEALLVVLMTPQDNLSLAQTLRSPLFSASDEDLAQLADSGRGPWFERLQALAPRLDPQHSLARAARLLDDWRALAGHIPIHDLLERIFHESNLQERYRAAFPPTQVARVSANLTRFVELALEVDSGRYPTLPRFLERLRQLRNLEKEGPSQATPGSHDGGRVRLLTIHAAKGLEAPVVFLVDSASAANGPPGYQALVRWPAEADRPEDFLLLASGRQRDAFSSELLRRDQEEAQCEAANLLYVALTRARDLLIVSGCRPARNGASTGWWGQLATALCDDTELETPWVYESGEMPATLTATMPETAPPPEVDPRLSRPIVTRPLLREIAPSHTVDEMEPEGGDPLGRERGLAIHRLLQLATDPAAGIDEQRLLQQVAGELGRAPEDPLLHACWQEVEGLLPQPHLAWLFHPAPAAHAFNEIPIQYREGEQTVHGIIDRLLKQADSAHIVDYKTHRLDSPAEMQGLVAHYRPQLELYRRGVQKLWPHLRVRCYLLFTHNARLVEIDKP